MMATPGPPMAPPRRSKESQQIGAFTREGEIGRGSFATVYRAIHTSPSNVRTLVAIKSVSLGKLNKKLRDNLTSEISILKGLRHPHIVALIDCKESREYMHLIMEFVALGDLSFFIKKRDTVKDSPMVGNMMVKYPNPRVGGLNEVVVRHFLQQLASALQFLRARNLIHRDVKPQNLLLNPSPEYFANAKPDIMPYRASDDALNPVVGIKSLPMLKIADFGFARSLPSTSLAETLCGSPLYMAPEILRYEKYDAKADLWSVGTVLYEMMTSKPPFRASNHVELLRRIEKGEDKIKFPDEVVISDTMQKLIRALLKRDPKERMSFPDFFANEILNSQIPGLVGEDAPEEVSKASAPRDIERRRSTRTDPTGMIRPGSRKETESPYSDSYRNTPTEDGRPRLSQTPQRPSSGPTSRPNIGRRLTNEIRTSPTSTDDRPVSPSVQRPALLAHATAPGRQELMRNTPLAAAAMARGSSGGGVGPGPSLIREQVQDRERERLLQRQKEKEDERVAQDIAFERDYIIVEKKQVEVNALADELENSPKLNRVTPQPGPSPQSRAMVRRATSQNIPSSINANQTGPSRAVQIASSVRQRPEITHQRQNSYERRYGPSPTSAASAISKALSMAGGRLFNIGVSPPISLPRPGRSPPVNYNPYPAYPAAQNSLVVVGEGGKSVIADEDTKFVQNIEDVAHRSDVVYGFAEVKYKQLTPNPPSQAGLGLQQAFAPGNQDDNTVPDDGLTVEAIVTVAEEALVLYVKALSLLAKSMDVAARWWAKKKDRGEIAADGTPGSYRTGQTSISSPIQRTNSIVQWVRGRFNEVLEKAELVRLKLVDNQRRLPEDHPCHPNNVSAATGTSSGMATSADHIIVSSGITAEKLMYDRALEMSRSAAINELTGEDLPGCEISYVTAIRMLEAVLESEDDIFLRKSNGGSGERPNKDADDDDTPINGMEAEDRKTVRNLVASIRQRLGALRRKLQVVQKRASAPAMGSPGVSPSPIPHRTSNPSISSTSPR